jgi:tripartite-type tricarboxylate transporter receptor subunit TctC
LHVGNGPTMKFVHRQFLHLAAGAAVLPAASRVARAKLQRGRCVSSLDKLNKEINAGLADPKLKARFAELGSPVLTGSPTDFGKPIADETEKWTNVVKFAGIEVE